MAAYLIQTSAQLSAHLRSLRKSRNLTQEQLGTLVGLNQSRIAKIEHNPAQVSVDQLLRILAALKTQILLQEKSGSDGTRPTKRTTEW